MRDRIQRRTHYIDFLHIPRPDVDRTRLFSQRGSRTAQRPAHILGQQIGRSIMCNLYTPPEHLVICPGIFLHDQQGHRFATELPPGFRRDQALGRHKHIQDAYQRRALPAEILNIQQMEARHARGPDFRLDILFAANDRQCTRCALKILGLIRHARLLQPCLADFQILGLQDTGILCQLGIVGIHLVLCNLMCNHGDGHTAQRVAVALGCRGRLGINMPALIPGGPADVCLLPGSLDHPEVIALAVANIPVPGIRPHGIEVTAVELAKMIGHRLHDVFVTTNLITKRQHRKRRMVAKLT